MDKETADLFQQFAKKMFGLNKRYDNITVKKIPQSVLDKFEYGVDNLAVDEYIKIHDW